ncbi:hypothetical protein J45TS6_32450 [Paenibacillus sp. J45TS6]|uniref:hypothetical protein n=1 Tax=Paenibacillus sp. J45TS6 TaxID=2807196 RepID=UPI001B0E9BD5|nr:hypothetical protein [Paenibacillus sp. J45TS6]GIP44786.1 hypothetical protein J45TS6_32450 [Paenibacillus sp. J45TS6]
MNLLSKEKEAKIAFLESMTRSQLALSRILTIIADRYELISFTEDIVPEHMLLIERCRLEMAEMSGMIKFRPLNKGTPAPPWYANQLLPCKGASQDGA